MDGCRINEVEEKPNIQVAEISKSMETTIESNELTQLYTMKTTQDNINSKTEALTAEHDTHEVLEEITDSRIVLPTVELNKNTEQNTIDVMNANERTDLLTVVEAVNTAQDSSLTRHGSTINTIALYAIEPTENTDNVDRAEKTTAIKYIANMETLTSANKHDVNNDINFLNNDKDKEKLNANDSELETHSYGLSLLAQYDSDSNDSGQEQTNNDSKIIKNTNADKHNYRQGSIEITSDTDNDDDVSDDTEDSTSGSDCEGEYLMEIRKEIDQRIHAASDPDLKDGEKKPNRRQPPKVKGELLLDDLPPIQDLQITVPEEECIQFGRVQLIVDQLVLVTTLPNSLLLDLDTVLFLDKGHKVLGAIFDVLGQVADPTYCVRFNSNEQIKQRGINIGDLVYCAPKTEYTQFVILSKLMQMRGSDASWENDIEPPPRYLDYSDDEMEREARAKFRNYGRQTEGNNDAPKRTRRMSATVSDKKIDAEVEMRPRQRDHRDKQAFLNENFAARYCNNNQQYNYHPSYNSGSWHSNYYHNYHPPVANFNIRPLSPPPPLPPPQSLPQLSPSPPQLLPPLPPPPPQPLPQLPPPPPPQPLPQLPPPPPPQPLPQLPPPPPPPPPPQPQLLSMHSAGPAPIAGFPTPAPYPPGYVYTMPNYGIPPQSQPVMYPAHMYPQSYYAAPTEQTQSLYYTGAPPQAPT